MSKHIKILVIITYSLSILCFVVIGINARLFADDFCTASTTRNDGLLSNIHDSYFGWSGRYSAHFLDGLYGLAEPNFASLSPIIILVFLLISLSLALKQNGIPLWIAPVFVSIIMTSAPNIRESLYWGQGMRAYLFPLIFWCMLFAVKLPFTAGLLSFLISGFSETAAAAQVSLMFILLVQNWHTRKTFFLAASIGSLTGLIIVMLAPGNENRQSLYADPTLLNSGFITIKSVMYFFARSFTKGLPQILAILSLSLFVKSPGSLKPTFTLLIIGFLTLACFAPAAWAKAGVLPARGWIIPETILLIGLWIWASKLHIPENFGRVSRIAAVVILISVGMLNIGYPLFVTGPALRSEAQAWDRGVLMITEAKNNGQNQVVIPGSSFSQVSEYVWIEECIEDYYEVDISLTP